MSSERKAGPEAGAVAVVIAGMSNDSMRVCVSAGDQRESSDMGDG